MTHFDLIYPHHDIHRWKAMDLSVLTVWPPPSRVEPVGRQIFCNASGMVSSHDLTWCHTDVHSLDSSSLLNAHCLHCLSVFAISPRSLSWLSSCIAFIAKSFVAFAATWPVSNHPSLLWDFSIMNDLFPSPPIHIIVAFYILCSTSRSTLLPMLITSRC